MKKYISLIVVVLAFIGCQNSSSVLQDYYVDQNPVADLTIMETLAADENYNLFVELANESGVADTMKAEFLYTVFAPSNAKLIAEGVPSMSNDSIKLYLYMHICANPKTTATFDTSSRLKMFSDKYLDIQSDEEGVYTADGITLTEPNIRCADGYIHKVEDVLIPRLTVYEWLLALSDDYSIFKEALTSRSTLELDYTIEVGSTPQGRPIFDSVYKVVNDIMDEAPIGDESSLYRYIVPSNDVINTTYVEMADMYLVKNMTVDATDSAVWLEWYLKTAVFDYSETGIKTFDMLDSIAEYSVFGNEFRPSSVTMSEPVQLSNGYGYTISKGHLPNYIPMSTVTSSPYDIRNSVGISTTTVTQSTAGYDTWNVEPYSYQSAIGTNSGSKYFKCSWYQRYYQAGMFSYRFKSCNSDSGSLSEVNLVPGNYILTIKLPALDDFVSGTTNSTAILDQCWLYLNGEFIENLKGIRDNNYPIDEYTVVGGDTGFQVGDSLGMVEFELQIYDPILTGEDAYTDGVYNQTIVIGDFRLTPFDNY